MKKLFAITTIITCLLIVTSLSTPGGDTSLRPQHQLPDETLSKDSIITELRQINPLRLEIIEEKSRNITDDIKNSRQFGKNNRQ